MIKIEYPVKLSEQYEIVDKWNNVVIPSITWNRAFDHLDRQKEIGELIVSLLNRHEDERLGLVAEPQIVSENGNAGDSNGIVAAVVEAIKRKRGRPKGSFKKK